MIYSGLLLIGLFSFYDSYHEFDMLILVDPGCFFMFFF
jgi:hypothetical protein